ncbi:MAG: archease [Candidatus Omnitrophica bacterium]|nr:archease [Candidatus Omnitrophota bacterium]
MKRYEQFPHTADIGVRVFGVDLKELFENAAFAMFDLLADLEGLKGDIVKDFEIKAPSKEELLVDWLDELLFNFYTKSIIFFKFDVREISETGLKARAFGRPVASNKNRLKTEIKAATYSDLKIVKDGSGYRVEIIFDV